MRYVAIYTVALGRPFSVRIEARGSRIAAKQAEAKGADVARAFDAANGWVRGEKGCPLASTNPADWTLVGVWLRDDAPGPWAKVARLMRRGIDQETAIRATHEYGSDIIGARAPGRLYRSRGDMTGPLPMSTFRGFFRAMLAGYGNLP